ncbi:hypothetical protein BDZ88DRAFT_200379 [Geranomyces variabilis]|nr:hypothetical protein BDZ88DRAFT_200379 [Geranomyces variabilis]KAJ3133573.1 hypothetical protein HDU90_005651 [Geranomyces variabilis]
MAGLLVHLLPAPLPLSASGLPTRSHSVAAAAGKLPVRQRSSRKTTAVWRKSSQKHQIARSTSRARSSCSQSRRLFSAAVDTAVDITITTPGAAADATAPDVPAAEEQSPSVSPAKRKIAYHHPALRRTDSFSSVWSDVIESESESANEENDERDEDSGYISPLSFDDNGDSDYRRHSDYDAAEVDIHQDSDEDECDFFERHFCDDSSDDYKYPPSVTLHSTYKHGPEMTPHHSIMLLDDLLHDVEAFKSDKRYAPTLKSQRSRVFTIRPEDAAIEVPTIIVADAPGSTPSSVDEAPGDTLATPSPAGETASPTPSSSSATLSADEHDNVSAIPATGDAVTSKASLETVKSDTVADTQRTYRAPDPRPKVAKPAAPPKKRGLKRLIRKISRILRV